MQEADFGSEIVQLVAFKIKEEEFGVEINQVKEIVKLVPITPMPRAPSFIEGVVNLRGQILVIIDLAKKLDIESSPHSDKTRIIVVELEDSAMGMIVDEVIEVLRLPKTNIDETPELAVDAVQKKYIKGVGKLGKRLLILVDLVKMLSQEEMENIKKTESIEKKEDNNGGKEKV